MHYADVVVFTPGDPKKSVFTYSVDESIQTGHLVHVPYGKKVVEGVVIRLHDTKPAFETKPVSEIVYPDPVLPSYVSETARWMSEYYHEPLRNCTEAALVFHKKVRLPKEVLNTGEPQAAVQLLPEQKMALDALVNNINSYKTFLLHGITGSGKTEVYLQFIEKVLSQEKQVIYLVPEIALTPQTIHRVEQRFPNKTRVLNSQISEGERYRLFVDCMSGERPIVIGSRSALFAPLPRLGTIIIDEAHDHSYKQESSPHYHALKVAEHIAESLQIPLILGSATPRVEDLWKAESGVEKFKNIELLTLTTRALNAQLPKIITVDMREELKKRNFSTLSDMLVTNLQKTLGKGEQAILFLNKRGIASSLMCRMCGWTAECPRCAVALTLHREMDGSFVQKLLCHHCDYEHETYVECPSCKSLYIKALGSGTERVEQDIKKILPRARILRMDRDTTTKKGSHQEIYTEFLNGKADILVGTQMITKGWDIPNVTLVGIVNADTALHMPYFRSTETMFQLVTQVSGRAGRADRPGTVVLQTYSPENYAVRAACNHSYSEFYSQEINFRKSLSYPPFSSLVQLTYSDLKQERAESKSEKVVNELEQLVEDQELQGKVEILGPAPGLIPKLRNKWYYQILLKGDKSSIDKLLLQVPSDWVINVDPENSV